MNAMQVKEWELFGTIEPLFAEDKLIHALAYIASIFANGTMKLKGGRKWTHKDFLIDYYKKDRISNIRPKIGNLKEGAKNILKFFGKNKKQKAEILKQERTPYALEKIAPVRTTRPKRLQRKGQRK